MIPKERAVFEEWSEEPIAILIIYFTTNWQVTEIE
jgi:hypothetical protein